MSNYFNTPSSFGFTTESSFSPDLINRNQNLSYEDLRVQPMKDDKNINKKELNKQHQYPQYEQQDEENKYEEMEYQKPEQMLEKVYVGLCNVQKTKIMRVIFKILSNKLYFTHSFAFGRLIRTSRSRSNNLTRKSPLSHVKSKYSTLNLILSRYLNRHIFNRKSKLIAFNTLKMLMYYQREKQLKILLILSNQYTNSQTNQLRIFFNRWKQSKKKPQPNFKSIDSQAQHYNKNNMKRLSHNFIIAKKQLACKLLLAFLKNKAFNEFYKIKHVRKSSSKKDVGRQNSAKTRKNSGNSYKTKNQTMAGPIMSSSYSSQLINTKKMIKMPQKSLQAKPVGKNYLQIVFIMLSMINKAFIKKKRQSFNVLLSSYKSLQKNIEMKDDPNIYTNILKHMCWLYSGQQVRLKLQSKASFQQERNRKLKIIINKKANKYREKMRTALRKWNNIVIEQEKIKVMNRVKQLQNIKYNFIESYK